MDGQSRAVMPNGGKFVVHIIPGQFCSQFLAIFIRRIMILLMQFYQPTQAHLLSLHRQGIMVLRVFCNISRATQLLVGCGTDTLAHYLFLQNEPFISNYEHCIVYTFHLSALQPLSSSPGCSLALLLREMEYMSFIEIYWSLFSLAHFHYIQIF